MASRAADLLAQADAATRGDRRGALLPRRPPQAYPPIPSLAMSVLGTATSQQPGIADARQAGRLPLIVRTEGGVRVEAGRRERPRGDAWMFDDTSEHEGAVGSDALRIMPIADILHPDLSATAHRGTGRRARSPVGGL